MKFKIILLTLLLILLSSFVSASLTDGLVAYYSYDDGSVNDTWQNYDGTNQGTTNTTGKLGSGRNFVAASTQYIDFNTQYGFVDGDDFFTDGFFKYVDNANYQTFFGNYATGTGDGIVIRINDDDTWQCGNFDSGAVYSFKKDTTPLVNGNWYYLGCFIDGGTGDVNIYKSAVEVVVAQTEGGGGATKSNFPAAAEFWSGAYIDNFFYLNGVQDELGVWDRSLNLTERLLRYNSGDGFNPIVPESIDDHTESTAIVKQSGTTTLLGSGFHTILDSDFNVSLNNSDLYGAYSFNVLSNNANDINCQLLIDSIVVEEVNRTNINGVLGSVFLQSGIFSLETGTHNQLLQCRKTGLGIATISNAVGIGHFMVDEFNNTLNHEYINITGSTSSSNFEKIAELNITISNDSTGGVNDVQHMLVLDWAMNYVNNDISDELLNTYISINGSNCSFYPRTTSSGSTASATGDCLIKNATTNTTYHIEVFGKGANADFTGTLVAKEFIMSSDEIEGGTGFPVNTSFIGDTNTLLFNFTGGNVDHGLTNVFQKISFSILSNETTEAIFFVKLVDGSNFTTINFTRTITSVVGILTGHDVLENVPQDTYVTELWVNCGSATANCTIVGGDGIGYITDVTTTLLNAFNITVFDNFDNSSILNFTVTDGAQFSTTTGSLLFFSSNDFENLTMSSNFNGGYFNTTILNHNVSNNLNVSLNQTLISWDCIEKVSGDDLNCTSPLESQIFNYNVIGNPHTQEILKNNYFGQNITFNVTALTSESKQVELYSTNLFINSSSDFGTITTCTYDITGITYPSYFESITGNPLGTIGLINGTYNIEADCTGFSIVDMNVTINETLQTLNFTLFTINSILFNIFDLNSLTLLSSLVEIELLGSTITHNINTSNGTIFIDGLNDDTYKITFTSSLYDPTIIFGTVSNNNHLNINAYMKNGTQKDFIVEDQGRVLQGNVTLTFVQTINGSQITIGQALTDFSGRASIFLDETVEYTIFAVKEGFITFTGQVTPTQSEYTIPLQREGDERFVSIFEDLLYSTTFTYTPLSGFAIAEFILNSPAGALEYYGMNTTYASINYFVNTSGIPAGGIETFNITGINPSIEPTITLNYFFKYNGRDLQQWTATYLVSDIVPTNITLENGLFDDLQALDKSNPIRGIIGAIIIAAFVLLFSFSRETSVIAIGGLIGLAINWKFELMPKSILTVSMIVIVILMIQDSIAGGR